MLFFAYAISAAVDWLYSGLPRRFPDLKICLSEGGIGWIAGLLDRLDPMLSYHAKYGTWERPGEKLTPAEVFTRNFWFCAVEDQSSFVQRDRISATPSHSEIAPRCRAWGFTRIFGGYFT